jgi:hypothetical protein
MSMVRDPGYYQPFFENGRSWRSKIRRDRHGYPIEDGQGNIIEDVVVSNEEALYTRDQWVEFETAILEVAQEPLVFFDDVAGMGKVTIPAGLGKTMYEYRNRSFSASATTSMDGLRESNRGRFTVDTAQLPLHIYHGELSFPSRDLDIAAGSALPLDTEQGQDVTRAIQELKEDATLGLYTPNPVGGTSVEGALNFTGRNTYTIRSPATVGWTPNDLVDDLIGMRTMLEDDNQKGPFRVWYGRGWSSYLDKDYSQAKGDNTVRARVQALDNMGSFKQVRRLSGYTIIMMAPNSTTAKIVEASGFKTVTWSERGGMLRRWLIYWAGNPLFRADDEGQCGLVVGTV